MALPKGTPQRISFAGQRAFQPAWSPDGQWLAYVTWGAESGGQVWKVHADGTGAPQQLTRVAAFYSEPARSPDGARILAVRGSRAGPRAPPFRRRPAGGRRRGGGPGRGRRPHADPPGARRRPAAFLARQGPH